MPDGSCCYGKQGVHHFNFRVHKCNALLPFLALMLEMWGFGVTAIDPLTCTSLVPGVTYQATGSATGVLTGIPLSAGVFSLLFDN